MARGQEPLRSTDQNAFAAGAICLVIGALAVYIPMMAVLRKPETTVHMFHRYSHDHLEIWKKTRWLGVETQKNPLDLWVYQEILHEVRPDVLIETGTYKGGSALFFASMFDLIGNGRVITIDIQDFRPPAHPRITYLTGSSTDPDTVGRVRSFSRPGETVMVALDSAHEKDHVLRELELYAPLVTAGSYLVVEDTALGTIVWRHVWGNNGPTDALREFLPGHPEFQADRSREKFGFTFNPGGWLRKEGGASR